MGALQTTMKIFLNDSCGLISIASLNTESWTYSFLFMGEYDASSSASLRSNQTQKDSCLTTAVQHSSCMWLDSSYRLNLEALFIFCS